MTKDFYIFRHGQSTYNVAGRTQGRTNGSVLTELGEEQAICAGLKLKSREIGIIVTSPLKRAIQTAELANRSLGLNICVDERFTEVDVGIVEGWPREDIKAQYPELYNQWRNAGNSDVCYPGGETRRQVRQRIFAGLDAWADKEYDCVAVSSHGIMLGQILTALNLPYDENIPNGAILHIRKENGRWGVIEWL